MKAFLVWNPEAGDGEGVVFTDTVDAKYASTGKKSFAMFGVPTLAEQFRETYAYDDPNKVFPIIEIEVPGKPKG